MTMSTDRKWERKPDDAQNIFGIIPGFITQPAGPLRLPGGGSGKEKAGVTQISNKSKFFS
jgi:hypothetical protein